MGSLTWPGVSIPGFSGVGKFGKKFFVWADLSKRFFEDIQNNLRIRGSAHEYLSRGRSHSTSKTKPNLLVFRLRFLRLGNSARDLLGVNYWSRDFLGFWFLPPFEHLRHLKSGVPPGIHGPKIPQKSIWKFSKKCL